MVGLTLNSGRRWFQDCEPHAFAPLSTSAVSMLMKLIEFTCKHGLVGAGHNSAGSTELGCLSTLVRTKRRHVTGSRQQHVHHLEGPSYVLSFMHYSFQKNISTIT